MDPPTEFFPAHTPIGVSVGGFQTSFQTGASVVSVADISAYTFTVSIDGEVARQMPASMGKAKYPTPPVGRFTALSKERNVTFDSRTIGIPLDDPEGYLIKGGEYGVRVTWGGGVYVHSAPWSVGSQGYANVSHGCINLSPPTTPPGTSTPWDWATRSSFRPERSAQQSASILNFAVTSSIGSSVKLPSAEPVIVYLPSAPVTSASPMLSAQ